jgi:uncharacterized cupin superfamily protein
VPKLDFSAIPLRTGSGYPAPLNEEVKGRSSLRLGDAGGLTQFGANLIILEPGAWSSHRHWHEQEDEFVMMLEGELVMIEDEGETIMRAGDCATYKAGVANGHHFINRSGRQARFLVIGTRAEHEVAHYSEVDMRAEKTPSGYVFTHKDGRPY